MVLRALGAFAVLMMGVGAAHAQDYASTPVPLSEFSAPPAADPALAAVAPADQTALDPFSPTVWRTGDVPLPVSVADGPQQRLQLSIGEDYVTPGGLPVTRAEQALASGDRRFSLNYSLGLPGALSFSTAEHDWSLTPHAGFGVSEYGSQGNAGAVLSIKARAAEALEDIGVHDGAPMAARSRYYVFAAASGRAVGLNVLRDSTTGDWRRAGWTTDSASNLVGEAQVGVGWRRGPVQTSLGYIHRNYDPSVGSLQGVDGRDDDRVAFSFSVRPH
jgi:hypothetical protein